MNDERWASEVVAPVCSASGEENCTRIDCQVRDVAFIFSPHVSLLLSLSVEWILPRSLLGLGPWDKLAWTWCLSCGLWRDLADVVNQESCYYQLAHETLGNGPSLRVGEPLSPTVIHLFGLTYRQTRILIHSKHARNDGVFVHHKISVLSNPVPVAATSLTLLLISDSSCAVLPDTLYGINPAHQLSDNFFKNRIIARFLVLFCHIQWTGSYQMIKINTWGEVEDTVRLEAWAYGLSSLYLLVQQHLFAGCF